MKRFKRAMQWIGAVLCLLGCCWFVLPVLHRGFALGAIFGFCVCALGFLLIFYYLRQGKKQGDPQSGETEDGTSPKKGWKRAALRLVCAFYVIGLAWAGYLTAMMVSAQYRTPPENTNVIVLGAQVYSAERMGVALTNRVNKAYEYLLENPQAKCIVTGGQGGDEPCPEALTEKNALVRLGIEESRIYMEDKSRNTRQNMLLSRAIAEREGLGTEVALSTQGFHMYRALKLAESAGFTPYSLVADTDPILLPEYYGRELLSLTKWYLESLSSVGSVGIIGGPDGPTEIYLSPVK